MVKETSEIVKLTERVSKDPKSKLFVPLAEEYKKTGDLEMAVYVLTEGLKHNPGYVTARSILGRLLLEQGDLTGSQRELEEVVKAIPDNLLAQRKLGDICILQNNPSEALKRYKSVLSLSPRDNEVAAIISDIEAGRDVSQKIPQIKSQSVPAKAASQEVKPQPSAPVTQTKQAAVQKAPPAATAGETVAAQQEEPEEILLVEPLEKEKSDQGPAHTLLKGEPAEVISSSPDQSRQTPASPDLLFTEPDIFKELKAVEDVLPAFGEKKTGAEIVDEKVDKEGEVSRPKTVVQEPTVKSDDVTTDTLAELYIAQGFYEKAIDIYERMLADKPNSKGLKDKLDLVKSMAAAVSAAEEEPKKASTDIFAEPRVYSAQQELAPEKKTVFSGEPGKEAPPIKREEKAPAGSADATAKFVSPSDHDSTRARPLYTDFEPREYVPPEIKVEEKKAENVFASPKSSTAIRKETIHRLEAWLKNIKKET